LGVIGYEWKNYVDIANKDIQQYTTNNTTHKVFNIAQFLLAF